MADALPVPDPPLSDGVVTLRLWTPADAPQVAAACQDPSISRYTTVPSPYTLDDAHAYIERSLARFESGDSATFAVVKDRGRPAEPGARRDRRRPPRTHRRGRVLGCAPARGRGAASRALRLVAPWALEVAELTVLLAEIRVGNVDSIRVAEAAGFVQTGAIDLPDTPENPDILLFARRP